MEKFADRPPIFNYTKYSNSIEHVPSNELG